MAVISLTQENVSAQVQKKNTRLLPKLLKKETGRDSILGKTGACEVQIIYTKISREKDRINFTDYYCNVNGNRYFYPSGTVFLPVAALTLEKITDLSKKYDLDKDRYVKFSNPTTQETIVYRDTALKNNYVSFAHIIRKMLVAGDDNSYNFCYDLLNQRYLNERIHGLGFPDSWFLHKFDNNLPESSRQSNTVTFFRTDVQSSYIDIIYLKRHPTIVPFYSIYVKNGEYNPNDYCSGREKIFLNRRFVKNGNTVDSAVNFTCANRYTAENMHGFMKLLIFPELYKNKLSLSDDDYSFLYSCMAEKNGLNYILNDRLNDPSIRIFNNSGKGEGFMIDNAYVIDTKNGVDFFLTVVIKCNGAGIPEDCGYEKTGLSYIKSVSRIVHQHAINERDKAANFDDFLRKIK